MAATEACLLDPTLSADLESSHHGIVPNYRIWWHVPIRADHLSFLKQEVSDQSCSLQLLKHHDDGVGGILCFVAYLIRESNKLVGGTPEDLTVSSAMSGAEVIGLVSGIIAIVDGIVKIHDAARNASGVPSTFRNSASWMPLLKGTMLDIQNDLLVRVDETSVAALQNVLESCKEKVQALEKVFETIKVAPDVSGFKRYALASRALGKSRKVEELTRGIQSDLQLLTASYTINASATKRVSRGTGENAITSVRRPIRFNSTITNHGSGCQYIYTGDGDQNVNTGSGGQFSGNFTGPFNFNTPAGI